MLGEYIIETTNGPRMYRYIHMLCLIFIRTTISLFGCSTSPCCSFACHLVKNGHPFIIYSSLSTAQICIYCISGPSSLGALSLKWLRFLRVSVFTMFHWHPDWKVLALSLALKRAFWIPLPIHMEELEKAFVATIWPPRPCTLYKMQRPTPGPRLQNGQIRFQAPSSNDFLDQQKSPIIIL